MNYYILYNGGKIYYTDAGEGDVVVLLHGYLETSDIWGSFARRLSTEFRVICVDLPGHGPSKVYGQCHSVEFMAGAVRSLLENLNIKKAFIAGHSMGGYVALALVELSPVLIRGYCLFHSHPFADSAETLKKRENEIKVVRSGKKYLIYPESVSNMFAEVNIDKFSEAVKRSKDIASTISDEGIIAALNGMMSRPSRLTVMERGKVPCLWLLGKLDKYIAYEAVMAKVNLPPNGRLVLLEKSGHMGFLEEEDLTLSILSGFIKENIV
jgi:pimeloyl-ACP methyl ester carboxylesterase